MLIFPAIDIIDGKVVRLYQGDYDKQESYGKSPGEFAASFEKAGAGHLHLVDLDGAKSGETRNFAVLEDIKKSAPGLFIEIGGGIRSEDSISRYIEAGAGRVILGTAALKNPDFVKEMLLKYGDKIAVGVDAKNGFVATEGWLDVSKADSFLFCRQMRDIGVSNVIYTDISRDGAMAGVNIEAYKKLADIEGLNITASGGVSGLEDIKALKKLNIYGAIIGKALYNGAIRLEEALAAAK